MKSIIQKNKECYVCKTTLNLHEHHIFFGTANRKLSEEYGLKVWLCIKHHEDEIEGVHFNKKLDNKLKKKAELMWLIEDYDRNINDFIKIFGKSIL